MVINDEDEDSNTALHLAALSGHNKVVSALLDAGADIEARNCTLWTPLDCAAAKGWAKTVRVLLDADAPVDPMDKSKTTPLHLASSRGHVQVVNLLISSHADVGAKDASNLNCLDMAIENGHKDVANAIIASAKYQLALRNQTEDEKTGRRNTPMRKLIRKMPDVAEKLFNKCTTSINHPEHHNFQITFDYEFLDDMYADWSAEGSDSVSISATSIYDEDGKIMPTAQPYTNDSTTLKANHPLNLMVTCNQEDLLAHPLVTSLLRHKWNSYGRYVYYLNLTIYCIFLTFLTGYVCTTPAPYSYVNSSSLNDSVGNQCEKIQAYYGPVTQSKFAEIGKYFIMALAAFNILREIFQIFNAKLSYFGWENLIEWVIYITALLLVIDFDDCQRETGIRKDWQWQLAAVCIFLAWIDLVLFIRKFPMFGIYVVMFTDVCLTFIQFFPVFFLFIVAFALSFFVLLANQYAFRNVGFSMLKTSVMMIGEMEYGDIFLSLEDVDPNSPEAHAHKLYYSGITYTLFVTFLILLSIIIMNLLVGLAVDDIKAVQEKAALTRLAMQVELALNVESILPGFLRRKFIVKSKTVYPNAYTGLKRCFHMDSTFMSSNAILKALDPELDDMERLEDNQEKMIKNINSLRFKVKNMEQQNARMEAMMKALLLSQGVSYEDEDANIDELLGLAEG